MISTFAAEKATLATYGDSPEQVYAAFEREVASFEALWPRFSESWSEPLPGREWSPAQLNEHVMLATETFSKIVYLLSSERSLPSVPKELGPVSDGKARSPAHLLPGEEHLPLDALKPRWQEVNSRLGQTAANIKVRAGRTFWHMYMGELDALGWLQVAVFHVAWHRAQLEQSLAAGR